MSKRKRPGNAASSKVFRPHLDSPLIHSRSTTVYRLNGRLTSSSSATLHEVPEEDIIPLSPVNANENSTNDITFDMGFCTEVEAEAASVDNDELIEGDGVGSGKSMDTPVSQWQPFRQSYLDELIRHDGRGGNSTCANCSSPNADLRCRDCLGGNLLCRVCLLDQHKKLPLHRISQWMGSHFEDATLKSIGLTVNFGHGFEACPSGKPHPDFVVVDLSGIHLVDVVFCGCYQAPGVSQHRIQLLRIGWFPATVTCPATAFTFDCLDTFHLLTLQGKISAYDFYHALAHKSENTGHLSTKHRYDQFRHVMRLWRHLKMLKRAGRGHDPAGVESTEPGQCAVECPACPHPGRNLPSDWRSVTASLAWLYSLILTVDANFRLKNKDRSIENDPALGDGWAHWVQEKPYRDYIGEYGWQEEPNLCESELHAVDHANKRHSKGYKSTGAGGVICGRHGLVRKNGLGDLQKGERYANMDFIVLATLVGVVFAALVLSYDIMCQWSRNLANRMPQFPERMRLSNTTIERIKKVIPKLHIHGHGQSCQTKFSLNYLKHSARTDGEEPERWWAHINPVSMSTKEMGPGSRHDTIDDHAAAWNWRKITGLGETLRSQLEKAIHMRAKHEALFARLTARFPQELVRKWEKMVEAWEENMQRKNPYEEPEIGITLKAVHAELAKEELEDAKQGDTALHDIPPNKFLSIALELEEQQRILGYQVSKRRKSKLPESADIFDKRNALWRRIENWQTIQDVYMPGASDIRAEAVEKSPNTKVEAHPLYLPSSSPLHLRQSVASLVDKERRLRVAQADDALAELRRLLRIKMGLWHYKFRQVGYSQHANTRARSMINRFKDKIHRCAERYRAARKALLNIDPTGDWITRLRELRNVDIRVPGNEDNEAEGDREVSWIWVVQEHTSVVPTTATEDEINESKNFIHVQACLFTRLQGLRVEWAKSRARAARWSEEVLLVTEEMRRVLWFMEWKMNWWSKQGDRRSEVTPELSEGLGAYAAKQVEVLRGMAVRFSTQWVAVLQGFGISTDSWPLAYRSPPGLIGTAPPVPEPEPMEGDEMDDDIF